MSPKYHVRANVALRGHCADRIAVSWSCWPPRESTLFTLMIVSERVKHNRNVACGHSQEPLSKCVKHNRTVECGHSPGNQLCCPNLVVKECKTQQKRWMWALSGVECRHSSAVSWHRVEGALNPKDHVRANVALHGHCADRVALSWSCWPPRESTLFSLMIVSTRVKHNRNVACGNSQEPNFVARHPLELCKIQYNR